MNLMLRPAITLVFLLLISLWMYFNVGYETSISFIFYNAEKVSVVLVILLAFFFGSFFSMFIFYRSLWIKKRKEKQNNKKEEKEKGKDKSKNKSKEETNLEQEEDLNQLYEP